MQEFLKTLYPRLQNWYNWYLSSQANAGGDNFTYSWRDKDQYGSLSSGLDDYPRSYLLNFNKEIHVDLQSWMIILSDFMSRFAYLAGDKENGDLYSQQNSKITANLHNLLFNDDIGLYVDYADK